MRKTGSFIRNIRSELSFDIVKIKLENSSRSNKNYALLLLSFTTYILVTTLSTTDVQLLFPELGVHLPLLNIDLPLYAFIFLAPLILTVLYANILLNLYEHIKLLSVYKELAKKQKDTNAHLKPILPFMVDNAYLNPEKSSIIFKFISYFILFIYPIFTLFVIFVRFSDYQNLWILLSDFFFFVLSSMILLVFLKKVINKNIISKWAYFTPIVLVILASIYLYHYFNPQIIFFNRKNSTFRIENLKNFMEIPYGHKYKIKSIKKGRWDTMTNHYDLFTYRMSINIKPTQKLPFPNLENYTKYLQNVQDLIKNDTNISTTLDSIPRIDLSNRSLKYADLSNIFLPYVIFENSNLKYTYMPHINLKNAKLKKTILSYVSLEYANLANANLEDINISNSYLYGVNLKNSIMHKVHFEYSDLSLANLSKIKSSSTCFKSCNLLGANVSFSDSIHNIIDSKLTATNLSYANIHFSKLDNNNFFEANLTECNLSVARLSNNVFYNSNLQNASLVKSKISNTVFINSNLRNVDLKLVEFKSTFLVGVNFTGVKNYNLATYKKTIILYPQFDKNASLELKKFFKSKEFQNLDTFFHNQKNNKNIINICIYPMMTLVNHYKKYKAIASRILIKFFKYWKKHRIRDLVKLKGHGLYGLNKDKLKELNNKYKTKEVFLTDKEIDKIFEHIYRERENKHTY